MAEAINIIVDFSDPPNAAFVEIEDDDGKSISIGKHTSYDGLTKIRITADDINRLRCGGDMARMIRQTDKYM